MSEAQQQPAAVAAVPRAQPAAAATYVTNLLGNMAQRDQRWANSVCTNVLMFASVGGYAAGYWLESFLYTTYSIVGAAILCVLVCGPNWRQRSDGDAKQWIAGEQTVAYFERLNAAEKRLAELEGRKPFVHHT
jgi:hypothetical protein